MLDITPQRGIGRLLFGMTRHEVEAILGAPTSRLSEDPGQETWSYTPPGLHLYFDADDDWRLESFEVTHPDTCLLGVPVFQGPYLDVLTQLAAAGLTGAEVRLRPDVDEVEHYFSSYFLHLWREDRHFTSCALGVPIGADDKPLWPHTPGNA